MSTLTNIIAATDLSAPSQHAVERAACVARGHDARLTLVHVSVPSAPGESDARSQLHALAVELAQRHGMRVVEHLETGISVPDIVVRLAEQLDAGLLVAGTRGAGLMRGVIIGSTAERIARFAKRPVLMVRQPVRTPYRRVLVPVDLSPWSLDAVRLADRIAPEATLMLMHAVQARPEPRRTPHAGATDRTHPQQAARAEAQRGLAALAAQTGLAPERLRQLTPEGSDPWTLIAQQERAQDCDLIVMGRQGRHALEELMLGSTTSKVLSECSADVLVSVQAAAKA